MAREASISAIVPVFNEAGNVAPLIDELAPVLEGLAERYEILVVDDGSTDGTVDEVRAAIERCPERPLRLVRMRRNFGQTGALAAGFRAAKGKLIVTLDGDMQNDPADLPAMLAELERGYDVVCGWRKSRAEGFLRRIQSAAAARVIDRLTGLSIHDYGCTLRVYRSEITRDLDLWGEMHRFIPALCAAVGARVTELPAHHRLRHAGVAKYGKTGLSRVGKVVVDLVGLSAGLSYHLGRPARIYGWWAATWVLGAVTALLLVILNQEEAGEVIGISATMLLSALVMLGLGAQAEASNRVAVRLLGRGPGYVRDEIRSAGWSAQWDARDGSCPPEEKD